MKARLVNVYCIGGYIPCAFTRLLFQNLISGVSCPLCCNVNTLRLCRTAYPDWLLRYRSTGVQNQYPQSHPGPESSQNRERLYNTLLYGCVSGSVTVYHAVFTSMFVSTASLPLPELSLATELPVPSSKSMRTLLPADAEPANSMKMPTTTTKTDNLFLFISALLIFCYCSLRCYFSKHILMHNCRRAQQTDVFMHV